MDTIAPYSNITNVTVPETFSQRGATFSFVGSDDATSVSFQCRLQNASMPYDGSYITGVTNGTDVGAWELCTPPKVSNLGVVSGCDVAPSAQACPMTALEMDWAQKGCAPSWVGNGGVLYDQWLPTECQHASQWQPHLWGCK